MRSPYVLSLCLVAIGAVARADAPPDARPDAAPDVRIESHEQIVVTAARIAEPIEDTVQHTTLIDAEAIRSSQASDVVTLLREQAGVELVQPGGVGQQTSLFMRGTNSNHTLVLIDGIRVGSATSGATAIDQIPLGAIDHIEIVRGNVSSLYGSGAIGGVIQIFTRSGEGHAPALSANAAVGTQDTYRLGANYGGTTEGGLRFNLGVGSLDTRAFPAIRSQYVPYPFVTRIQDLATDPYHQRSATFSLAKEIAPGHDIGANGTYSEAKVFYGGFFSNESLPRLSTVSAHIDDTFVPWWKSRISVARGIDTVPALLDGQPASYERTIDDQAAWHNEFDLGTPGKLTASAEYLDQHLDSDTAYTRTARHVASAALGWLARFGAHTLQANARTDRYSDFGHHDSTLAGYGYDLTEHWHASASVSTAFRAPTFIDLYDPFAGNPALRPETARSEEVALQYKAGGQMVRLTAFENRIRDLIVYQEITPLNFLPENVEQARIQGAELTWVGQWDDTRLSASLTLQNPVDRTTGEQLLRRARRFGSIDASRRVGAWRFTLQTLASGPHDDIQVVQFTRTHVAGYAVVNALADYRIDARQSVGVRIDNVFDKDYEIAQGYNVQRIGALVTWRYDTD